MKKIIIGILVASLLVSLYGVYLFSLNDKYIELLPDFHRNYNTVKFVSENWFMPEEIEFIPGSEKKGVMDHQPLYYFLSGGLLKIIGGGNDIIILQIFSVLTIFLTNIVFYLFLKETFKEEKIQIYGLSLFSFFPLHLYVSMFISPDPLFYLLFILCLYFFVKLKKEKNIENALIFGFLLGLVLLTRVYGIILIASLIVYILFLHFKKNKEKNLFLIGLIVGSVVGAYGILRNYFIFGKLLASIPEPVKSDINTFIRLFNSFWSGVYGGLGSIKIFIIFLVIILLFIFIYNLIRYFKLMNKKDHLLFLSIVCFLTLIQAINLTCNFTGLIQNLECAGDAAQNRYLIPFEPFLAIIIGFGLFNLNRKLYKYLVPIFVIVGCSVFAIDFIYALK